MMDTTVNDYFLPYNSISARVQLFPNSAEAANLINRHRAMHSQLLPIADCLPDAADRLPMPDELWKRIDEKLDGYNTHVVVTGIDAYLSLISEGDVEAFFVALKGRVDADIRNVTYLLSKRYSTHFSAPRYKESRTVVNFSGETEEIEPLLIEVVSDKWVKPDGKLTDYNSLLKRLGDALPKGKHILVINDLKIRQAGLSSCVSFLLDVRLIAERFHGITSDLNNSTLEMWLEQAGSEELSPALYLENKFGKANIDTRLALKRLCDMPDDELCDAYVWLLRKQLPAGSYISSVLASGVTRSNLFRKYVIDELTSKLHNLETEKYASERAEALANLPAEPLIIDFIGQTRDVEAAAAFLNCGTKAERMEIIRRVSKLDLVTGLPELFQRLYPTLADYLSTEYDYEHGNLTEYFKEYRRLKIRNTVTDLFAKRAYEARLPDKCPVRESLLLGLLKDSKTALLIVDGMGAEYLPLLLSMAARLGISVESYAIAAARLPTSTDFNKITVDPARKLSTVRVLDTTAHEGAEKHEDNPNERNIEKALQAFDDVFNRISEGLRKYERVVVSADHGSSRLAVIAYDQRVSHEEKYRRDLPWKGQPLDWRYSLAPVNREMPQEFEQQYHPSKNNGEGEQYWVVRGYNRLPKQGGKLNEMHGGATLEERLVPVVVFSKSKSTLQQKQYIKEPVDQIVDRMGFDEI